MLEGMREMGLELMGLELMDDVGVLVNVWVRVDEGEEKGWEE
jgi:hypothetical protein